MSAEIIQFVPRTRREPGTDGALASSYAPWRPDDLAMDHADTAPCESLPLREPVGGEDEPA